MIDSRDTCAESREKQGRSRAIYATLCVCCIIALIILAIVLPIVLTRTNKTESISTTTIDDITSTQEIQCIYPLAKSPSGNCVNLLIDIRNCGTVGYVCPTNYTSCSNGVCSTTPSVQLSDPIPIFTATLNGSVDDTFYEVNIPFEISLYNIRTSTVHVTTNGVLCLENCSREFTETVLPTDIFPGATAFGYWDDLFVYENTSQGIYYQTIGNNPNRTLIFEYYCSHYLAPHEYYHFQIVFFENKPNIVQYKYYDISDKGSNCTVGVQASSTGPFIQYSFQQVNSVVNNMTLTFDTLAGTYNRSYMYIK